MSSRTLHVSDYGPLTLTPGAITEEALNADPFDSDSRRNSRTLTLPAVQHRLTHGDADVPEWGSSTPLYKQPRSRAGPLPSKSVTDFRKLSKQALDERYGAPSKKVSHKAPSSGAGEYEQWTIKPAIRGNGSLINAMRAATTENGTHVSWVGTLGSPTDALPDKTKLAIQNKLANDYDEEIVYVSDQDFEGHYNNFCKIVLWPLFHYQVPDDVNSKAYQDRSWSYYLSVNRCFANQLIESYKRGDTIWVHDYHLLLVPSMVREKLPDAKIGFFLHTAFPSSEIFRCQEKYKDLLRGMLGANLVAFQLPEYAGHFLQTCSRFLRVEATPEGVQLDDRFVNVTDEPMGIIPAEIEEIRKSEEFANEVKTMQETFKGKTLIFSRDKLDRVHGVGQKLQAYERFLEKHPNRAEDTVLLQVLSSYHETNDELFNSIMKIQNNINRTYRSISQSPLDIWVADPSPAQYYALLTVCDVLMNSTQRDGMNLTAHEFMICQDGEKTGEKAHGALILSEFAGSAAILQSKTLRINPWDILGSAKAIAQALNMDAPTRKTHWAPLHKTVMELTGSHWYKGLSRKLIDAHQAQGNQAAASVPRLQTSAISKAYDEASSRLLVLDYEGTLVGRHLGTHNVYASPARAIQILGDLTMDPKNVVYVTSSGSDEQLAKIFQTASGVGLIAGNGCYKLAHGEMASKDWESAIDEEKTNGWKEKVIETLDYFQQRLPGSEIEDMSGSLVFRFDKSIVDKAKVDEKAVQRLAGSCADQLNSSCQSLGIRIIPSAESLLIEQIEYNKATMASKVFNLLQDECATGATTPPDFLMVAGDDRDDEPVFQWANDLSKDDIVRDVFTVSIGSRDTKAKAAMTKGSAGLLSVLEKLAQSSLRGRPVKNPATKRSTRFDLPTA